jgi:hypothetical protein
MIRFQIGDQVRIVDVSTAEWRGALGIVVKTVERDDLDQIPLQKCAVQFPQGRRWFGAEQLRRSTPPNKSVRLFRGEVLLRWKDLSNEDVALLNGSSEALISLLQERYGFSLKRAETEVAGFLTDVQERIRLATEFTPAA